ncbi:MAG: hypothetical protein NTW19_14970 [Planctomycetota bacterium]|nr:hypothetical protein [Planctomycetota bacterium]
MATPTTRFEQIVVLANSHKRTPGRCIAGRLLSKDNAIGSWCRPIRDETTEGELLQQHMKTANREPINVLDVMIVPLRHKADDKTHPEDWFVDASNPWRKTTKLAPLLVPKLEERPGNLWLDPTSRKTDRVAPEILARRDRHQSIYLIRPVDFRVEISNELNTWKNAHVGERRAHFTYNNTKYALKLTDPVFIARFARDFPPPNAPPKIIQLPSRDNCLLCVSLTPEFHGYHYKVVATVLKLP